MATATETVRADSAVREKAVRLFKYLKELTELRADVKRSCDEYDQVVWWAEIPEEKECYCAAWDLGKEAAYDDWIRVERPRRKRPPSPPTSLAPWLSERDISDSSLEAPPLREAIVEEVQGNGAAGRSGTETVVRKLEDWPAIPRQWDLYIQNHWLPWAREDRRLQNVQAIYNELFTAFQKQERLGEAFEVVVGIGLLTWHPPHGPQIRRHVVAAQSTLAFDSKTGVITVGPAADGARLSLEQEMLEPQDRPLPEIQNQAQLQLADIGDDIWTGPNLVTALNAYFQQLSSEHGLEAVLEPQDGAGDHKVPTMTFAPALIVRKRTDRSLVRIFSEIAGQMDAGGPVPVGVEKLVQIRDDKTSEEGEQGEGRGGTSDELYFPLPANEAQRQIAQRLSSRQGVLVQGPPGTGKSHTIANLICHLLATGKRLLVTSHTARALRVLKKYFPPEISPLCVSLLGDDAGALRELEESVQGILNSLNQWDAGKTQDRIRQMESDLDRSRRELAEAYSNLKKVRCSETETVDLGFGAYQGTPQALAQVLVAKARSHGWLSVDVSFHETPPLSNAEAVELLTLTRELGDEAEQHVQSILPEIPSLVEPKAFDQLVLKERELTARLQSVSSEARSVLDGLSRIPPPKRSSLENALHDYLAAFDTLTVETEPWVKRALHDVASGRHHSWENLATITEAKTRSIADKVPRASELRISGLEGRDRPQLRADAEILHAHLLQGKSIGVGVRYNPFASKHVKASLYIADTVRVNGRLCDQQDNIGDLIDYLDVTDGVEHVEQQWSAYVQPLATPLVLAFGEQRRRAEVLRRVLAVRAKMDAAALLSTGIPDLPPVAFHERQAVSALLSLLAAAAVQDELRGVQQHISDVQVYLGALRRDAQAHGLVAELLAAVEGRDLDRYSRSHNQVVAGWALRTRHQRRRALEHQLSRPELLAQFASCRHEPAWDGRLSQFESAWNWSRADGWLKDHADPHRESRVLQTIDLSQQRIRKNLRDLAALKAWQHVLARLLPEQREHLMAWKLAIKKIGKGTGKYALQYRKEAREHLDHCRAAIPAWVMPIFRVAETTTPAPNQFDVAIIDEASQSGPEALFLQYIARKIVVVGDDQQISPESVGLDRGAVDSLRQRYIKDLPHWDALGVDNSFFDQAQIRFAGRIRLREHFRCMPEIIQFSNNLCYQAEPLVPLRQYGTERVVPVVTRHIADGYVKGTGDRIVNRPEAEAIVEQIVKCLADPAYEGKSFGVIGLQGNAQANLIRDLLIDRIGAQKMQQRGIVCGNAYAFQGDERDVIFLSMVAAATDGRHIGVLAKESDKRRFNVAASRARDQMWLFHSVTVDDLSSFCLRRQLLEYCLNPMVKSVTLEGIDISKLQRHALEANRRDSRPPIPFDSWFEVDVFLQAVNRGFRVIPQYEIAGKRIDLLVEGFRGRLAVECDGDEWHGLEEWDRDVERQRMLERCGLQFWRVRGSAYYRDPESALEPLWQLLEERGIYASAAAPAPKPRPEAKPSLTEAVIETDEEEQEEFENGILVSAPPEDGDDDATAGYPPDEQGTPSLSELALSLPKYTQWMPRPLPDPHSASLTELMEVLIEIVSVEGPVICRRAYALYNRAAGNSRLGKQIVHVMNRAIYRAVKLGRLQQNDEQRRGGQINQIVRVAGGPAASVREKGPRTLEEVPPLEIAGIRDMIAESNPSLDEDEVVRHLAAVYGVGRVTSQIRKLLLA
jgi:very-short-patch-repair endonuclease